MIDRSYIHHIVMPEQRHEDYITWLNIQKQSISALGLKEDLALYRKTTNSLSGNKLKCLALGGNGFIGEHICRVQLEMGNQVVVYGRNFESLEKFKLKCSSIQCNNAGFVKEKFNCLLEGGLCLSLDKYNSFFQYGYHLKILAYQGKYF